MKIRTKSGEILDLAELRQVAQSFNRANVLSVDYEQIAADFLALLDALEAALSSPYAAYQMGEEEDGSSCYAYNDAITAMRTRAGFVEEAEAT